MDDSQEVEKYIVSKEYLGKIIDYTEVEPEYKIADDSSGPKGTLLSKFFLKPNTVNENIIDSFLNNLIWVKNETRRIFPEEHKYWDYSAGDSCASNIIYDIETNTSTNIDIEPSAWLTRDEYLEKTYYRLLKHFENFNSYPYCNFLPVLEMPKILDKCMKFIDKEVL